MTGGPVCYGPNVTDAATLLASTDVIGVGRAADLMGALLHAPVSTGFVSRCLVRLDAALTAAGFEGRHPKTLLPGRPCLPAAPHHRRRHPTEALRALKRRLSDIVYRARLADATPTTPQLSCAA